VSDNLSHFRDEAHQKGAKLAAHIGRVEENLAKASREAAPQLAALRPVSETQSSDIEALSAKCNEEFAKGGWGSQKQLEIMLRDPLVRFSTE
jgi:hypothetical protein